MKYESGKGLSGSPGALPPAPTPDPVALPKAFQGGKL
jgi:hypothetical protein